jgi:hypothetical protein
VNAKFAYFLCLPLPFFISLYYAISIDMFLSGAHPEFSMGGGGGGGDPEATYNLCLILKSML